MASKKTDKSGKTPKHGMDKTRANKEVGYMRSAATVCRLCMPIARLVQRSYAAAASS